MFNIFKPGKRVRAIKPLYIKHEAGNALAFISLCFFAIILAEFLKAANITAIISTYPIWIWGVILGMPALVSWTLFGSRIGLLASCSWLVFVALTNDHLPALSRIAKPIPALSEVEDTGGNRIITFDCYSLRDLEAAPFTNYKPRVMFLQGVRPHHNVEQFARELFGRKPYIYPANDCVTLIDGGSILESRAITMPNRNNTVIGSIIEWKPSENAMTMRLTNVSLANVEPFRNIFAPSSWNYYASMRYLHRDQIQHIMVAIKNIESQKGEYPIVLAGSFGVQATSPIFKPLASKLTDAYNDAATAYGATFPSNFPIFRFDRIFTSSLIKFKTCDTIYVPKANRKAVFADIYPNYN